MPSPRHDAAGPWPLDPTVCFLNHGSFGSCPRPVLDAQQEWRERMESRPVQFLARDLERLSDEAREALGRFIGAPADDLAFVPNATAGVNAVLGSLSFEPGDELVVTSHEYNACRNVLDHVASRARAGVVVADVPFPLSGPDDVLAAIEPVLTHRTRLLLVDHVTSPTALVFPVDRIIRLCDERGIDVLVDGAHAPGMVALSLADLGPAYYTANCHKWICAPKGAAFLYVRPDRQSRIRPHIISHGANSPRTDRSRFRLEFDWTGTFDPTASLCVPHAIGFMASLLPGGWPALMERNHQMAVAGREIVLRRLGTDPPCPASMLGAMASLPLPDGELQPTRSLLYLDPLQEYLYDRHAIEVPLIPWPAPPKRLLRISAQVYNSAFDYERLAAALRTELSPPA